MADLMSSMDSSLGGVPGEAINKKNNLQTDAINSGIAKADGTISSSSIPNPNKTVTVVENAAELALGAEFEDIQILSNAQVAVYLQANAASAVNRDEELHEVYRKTLKYVDRFNSMMNPEKENQELIDELDNLQDALTTFRKETDDGEEMVLHISEVAALMNLVATDTQVEEAMALIPSLSRFPEAAIDEILDLIRSTMIRIVS